MIDELKYIDFFLGAPRRVIRLERLEFRPPDFTRVYYIARNDFKEPTATCEDGQSRFHEYYPLFKA